MVNAEHIRTAACHDVRLRQGRPRAPAAALALVQLPTGLLRLGPQYTASAPHTLLGRAASCAGSVEKTEEDVVEGIRRFYEETAIFTYNDENSRHYEER